MKPGRNDPCPCGSGKKYKKCCQDKDNGYIPPIIRDQWRKEMEDDFELGQQRIQELEGNQV